MYRNINIGNDRPAVRPPRRFTSVEQHPERREVEELLEGRIEPSESHWACQTAKEAKPIGSIGFASIVLPRVTL